MAQSFNGVVVANFFVVIQIACSLLMPRKGEVMSEETRAKILETMRKKREGRGDLQHVRTSASSPATDDHPVPTNPKMSGRKVTEALTSESSHGDRASDRSSMTPGESDGGRVRNHCMRDRSKSFKFRRVSESTSSGRSSEPAQEITINLGMSGRAFADMSHVILNLNML